VLWHGAADDADLLSVGEVVEPAAQGARLRRRGGLWANRCLPEGPQLVDQVPAETLFGVGQLSGVEEVGAGALQGPAAREEARDGLQSVLTGHGVRGGVLPGRDQGDAHAERVGELTLGYGQIDPVPCPEVSKATREQPVAVVVGHDGSSPNGLDRVQ
jgi:hypothetical protein